jgi:hypothetical protein
MFRKLAELLPTPQAGTVADAVFTFHPEQLNRWLEEVWANNGITAWSNVTPSTPLGNGDIITMTKMPSVDDLFPSGVNTPTTSTAPYPLPPGFNNGSRKALGTNGSILWDHLFYAYLVESTGIVEIMAEVVRRYVTGESLPIPNINTTAWVRGTEDLFFRDPPLFRIGSLTSQLRPDARINRRNVYWRMFGVDLPHPLGGVAAQPWKVSAGPASNVRFLEMWNELLRQVWMGIENEKNKVGSNPTDNSYLAYLCKTIGEMLRLRRRGGVLAREEFSYVCMLNWFHLTVDYDSQVIVDLSATAGANRGNPADRLEAVGQRVGIAPSRQARELFELADLISPVMWAFELGMFDDPSQAFLLYTLDNLPAGLTPIIADTMNRIVDLWQSATGERVKDLAVMQRKVQMPTRSPQPTKVLPGVLIPTAGPRVQAAPSTNGKPVPARG